MKNNFVDSTEKKPKFKGLETLKLLELALNKPNETTPNQLKHEHKKARIEQEREDMFLATGGSLPSSAASNFFKNGQTANGFSVSGKKDVTFCDSKIPTNDNPVYRM